MAVIKRNKKASKGSASKYFNTKKEADSYFKKK